VKRRPGLAGPLAAAALVLAGVGGGAYWLGTKDGTSMRADQPQAGPVRVDVPAAPSVRTPAPPPPIAPVPVAEAPPLPVEPVLPKAEPEPEKPKPVVKTAAVPGAPKLSNRVRERLKRVRAQARRDELAQARAAQVKAAEAAAAEANARAVALVPPGPRGRIVQLGAFSTVPTAQENWRAVAARWPYLTTKPRILSPTWVRQGRRWKLSYRLQLGTASQAQSVVICQRLQRTGQPCVVVY
jgi:hypothetical protein